MKVIDYKAIGKRIRKQRELLGYTREQLAEKLEVSAKFCSDIELGVKVFSLTTLMKLSEFLCLSTDYILFGNEKNNSPEIEMLSMLIQKCPENSRNELLTIVNAYVKAVTSK